MNRFSQDSHCLYRSHKLIPSLRNIVVIVNIYSPQDTKNLSVFKFNELEEHLKALNPDDASVKSWLSHAGDDWAEVFKKV